MKELWTQLGGRPVLAIVAVVGLLAIVAIVAFFLLRRKKGGGASVPADAQPPAESPLSDVYRAFVEALPEAVRGAPIALVLGARRSGKTSCVLAARGGRLTTTSATDDPRLALYFGENQLSLELSADLWQDVKAATVRDRRRLIRAIAWQTSVAIVVVDPTSPDATPEGLTELGRRLRKVLDELDAERVHPVAVRVCITHLDATLPGFTALFDALAAANDAESEKGTGVSPGVELPLHPVAPDAASLADTLSAVQPFLVRGLDCADLRAIVDFAGTGGPQLLGRFAPLLTALVGTSTGVVAPTLDGLYLAALPPAGPATRSGDPFLVPAARLDALAAEVVAVSRRRTLGAGALAAAASLALTAPYAVQWSRLTRAEAATEALSVAVNGAGAIGAATSAAVADAEAQAAVAVKAVVEPRWPPLRAAFPARLSELRGAFLGNLRRAYLLPIARRSDPVERTLALGVLYATRDGELRRTLDALAPRSLEHLGLPASVFADYVALSVDPWTETPDLPPLPRGSDTSPQRWAVFLDALDAAFGARVLTDAELAPLAAEALARAELVQEAAEQRTAAEVTEALRARGLPVDRWLGPSAISAPGARWVADNEAVLAPLLALVAGSTLAAPADRDVSLVQAISTLGAMVTTPTTTVATSTRSATAPTKRPAVYGLTLLGRTHFYDRARWDSLLQSSRAAAFVDHFLASTAPDPGSAPLLLPDGTCVGAVGAAAIPGRGPSGSIPCELTRDVFSRSVAPTLAGLDATLDALGLPADARERLTRAAADEASSYAESYRGALLDYYSSFQLGCASAGALGVEVADLVSATSFMTQFLVTVATNADLGPQEGDYLEAIGDSTADLAPIVALMTEVKGKYPNLDSYYAILRPLVPLLTATPAGSTQVGTPLAARVSPIGTLALELLAGGDASALVQVTRWLDGRGVPQQLRAPFLLPIQCAYRLGLSEVERAIARAYEAELLPTTEPFFYRFPFDRTSALDASAVDVQAVFGPKGSFLQTFDAVVRPVLDELGQGRLAPKTAYPGRTVAVPSELLDLARFAAQLRSALWTADGQPRALALSVQPLPLRSPAGSVTTTLSSLRAGKATVFGFNQTPSWRGVEVSWGLQDTASVALRASGTGAGAERYHSIDAGPSDWAFFRLLVQAQTTSSVLGTVTASWSLPLDVSGAPPQVVSFAFQSDPWRIFQGAPVLK
jgi:hypothetical protein